MHDCYFGYSISKAGHKMAGLSVMFIVMIVTYDCQKKHLLYYDAYGAILRKDIHIQQHIQSAICDPFQNS
jgi:hypothetical protein